MTDVDDGKQDAVLDECLGVLEPLEPSAALMRAVAEIPLRHPRPGAAAAGLWWPLGSLWQTLVSAVLVAALGVSVGLWTAEAERADDGWDEFGDVAFAVGLDEELAP